MNKLLWKKIDPSEFFNHIDIPDDWNSLEDFVNWYVNSKMPLMIPFNAEVIRSDDACAISIFKKGNYQVEFYLEYPEMWIRKHCHPRMEVMVMHLGGGSGAPKDEYDVSKTWGTIEKKLLPGEYHGGNAGSMATDGFITLAFQRWENQEEMTSAAIQWKGEIQGPVQKELIKSKKKNAFVNDTYADVTDDPTVFTG
jgi:hypothetical protein